jgi:hypothetical protein
MDSADIKTQLEDMVGGMILERSGEYTSGGADFSASQLPSPIQQVALKARYAEQIPPRTAVEDFAAWRGNAIHEMAERYSPGNAISEERLFIEVLGKKISGQFDLYHGDTEVVVDYKTVSVWALKLGRKPEWDIQLNVLAELLRQNGFRVRGLYIMAILWDWNRNEALRSKEYPQQPWIAINVPLWPERALADWLIDRVQSLIAAESMDDETLHSIYPCSKDDQWARDESWAVKKAGNKKATRVCQSHEEARQFIIAQAKPGDYIIEHREPIRMRCDNYCDPAMFCVQRRNEGGGAAAQEEEVL